MYLCIVEIFGGINFHQCGKGRHILYVIINTGQKIHVIKISPMRADGEIGENFCVYGTMTLVCQSLANYMYIEINLPYFF